MSSLHVQSAQGQKTRDENPAVTSQLPLTDLYLFDSLMQGMTYRTYGHEVEAKVPGRSKSLLLDAYDYRPERELCAAPVVMIHGAGHAAFHFRTFLAPYLAEHGIRCIAFSARGHGYSEHPGTLPFKLSTLRTHIRDTVAVLTHFKLLDSAPIFLGHEVGGTIAEKLIESGIDARAGILLSPIPHTGAKASSMRFAKKHPLRYLSMHSSLSLRTLFSKPEQVQERLFSAERPVFEIQPFVRNMGNYYYRAHLETLKPDLVDAHKIRSTQTPLFMAVGERDAVFTPDEHQAHSRALGIENSLHVLKKTAHDIMLEPTAPELGDAIISFLKRNALMR